MARAGYRLSDERSRSFFFRAPEDRFVNDDEVARRHRSEVISPAIEQAIADWDMAKRTGDESDLRRAAKAVVDSTSAAFRVQGVPTFAHPVLPPQFVRSEVEGFRELPRAGQVLAVQALLDVLDSSARPGAAEQFKSELGTLAFAPVTSVQAQSYPPAPQPKPALPAHRGNQPIEHAPTWVPDPEPRTWSQWLTEPRQPARPPGAPPAPVVERTWDQEQRERAATGARERRRQEAYDNFWGRFGFPISPEEQLRRKLAGDVVRRGDSPVYLSGKEPHPDDPYKDRVSWPTNPNPGESTVVVTGPFGQRTFVNDKGRIVEDFHPGADFRNTKDQPVFSPKNGTILRIVRSSGAGGNLVYILHDDGSISAFFHTSSLQGMEKGDEVYAGQRVGVSDGSGEGPPHTHYSYFPAGTPIDPRTGLPIRGSDDHDRKAPARTQTDPFGAGGPYYRGSRDRPPSGIKR